MHWVSQTKLLNLSRTQLPHNKILFCVTYLYMIRKGLTGEAYEIYRLD